MRTLTILILTIALTAGLHPSAGAADAGRPVALLFETVKGDGADRDLASSTTRAIRTYLRDTQRVEATIFNRESPTVQRAVMESKLTLDKVASYSSQSERIEVARVLSFRYAAGAEVTMQDDNVTVKLWVADVEGGKPGRWEATGTAASSGAGAMDLDNAMQSAASSAVIDVARRAFADLPRIAEPAPASVNDSLPIEVPVTQPTATDYIFQADRSLDSGNLAMAIQQYLRAINAEPANGALRVKLAQAYARRAMFREAEDELNRAEKAGASAEMVAQARQQLEQLRDGQEPGREQPKAPQPEPRAVRIDSKPAGGSSDPAVARIVEGDRLWGEDKPDEAAEAYREAIRLNSSDWRAHERLAVVNASVSLFGESRKALEELTKVQPDPPAAVAENRYAVLRKAFDRHFSALIKQYDRDSADFASGIITRESYYSAVNGLALRLESMAKFLDALMVPESRQAANLRRSLACGLMAQAASNLLDFLETNSNTAKSNAGIFSAQAKKEIEAAERLEETAALAAK